MNRLPLTTSYFSYYPLAMHFAAGAFVMGKMGWIQ